ncbi:DUF805 domain-containing protein [Mucilaginibacter limnophilus]|uniref:DUF805 domain-containing protein n=1 Tax=Mucilaginibacter limnophilus TaxID=1932778 RepID=A0A3S2UKH0_9SPHI|nr:DUF805 domain-containing protein [Mucilaginibacter limnophilus]RVT99822.1 DUF805 domain-containing protein [Mucilaginibacter limnophilus]
MFKNSFSFYGRIRRTEYAYTLLIYLFVSPLLQIIAQSITNESISKYFDISAFIALTWFYLAQSAKRCYDMGKMPLYQFIPMYNLWMLFSDGEPYANQYGLDPKGREIGTY